jgi:hypothetical protein
MPFAAAAEASSAPELKPVSDSLAQLLKRSALKIHQR